MPRPSNSQPLDTASESNDSSLNRRSPAEEMDNNEANLSNFTLGEPSENNNQQTRNPGRNPSFFQILDGDNTLMSKIMTICLSMAFLTCIYYFCNLLVMIQIRASMRNHNLVPNYHQNSYKKDSMNNFYKIEIENFRNNDVYDFNDTYSFRFDDWQIFANNEIDPIGQVSISEDQKKNFKTKDLSYVEYLDELFDNKKEFIVEFKKTLNALFFYTDIKQGLLLDRIFKLKDNNFIGLYLREAHKNGFKNFLYDQAGKFVYQTDKIKQQNEKYTDRLILLKYLLINEAFSRSKIIFHDDYILIMENQFKLLLMGDCSTFIHEIIPTIGKITKGKEDKIQEKSIKYTITDVNSRSISVHSFYTEYDESTEQYETNIQHGTMEFNTTRTKYFLDYLKSIFNHGPMARAKNLVEEAKKTVLSRDDEFNKILKNKELKDSEKYAKLVREQYNVTTGWEVLDEILQSVGSVKDLENDIPNPSTQKSS